jgi:hypothetical protein
MLCFIGIAMLAMAQAPPPSAVDAGPEDADATVDPALDAGVEANVPDAGVDAHDEPPPLSDEERRALEAALASDASANAANAGASGVPDLSKVNVAAALPGALQSMNPDMAFILDVAGAWFSVDEPAQTGGHDPTRTGFALQQLELSIGASVDPFMRFDSNIVFSLFGVEVEEAYATTLALPANLQLRAGQFLTRFGRINPTHPHAWKFVDQPLAIGKMFGSEGSRGLGVEGSWLAPLPWYLETVLSVTNADGECCARSFLGGDDIGVKTPLDLLVTGAVKQFFPLSDDLSLLLGLSTQLGPNASGNLNRTEIVGGDVVLRYRPLSTESGTPWSLSLEAEALFRGRQVPFGTLHDGAGYAQLVWSMSRQWETAARYELGSGVDSDPLDPEWTTWRQRAAVQLTYYPSHFSRLRVQGSVDHLAWQQGLPAFGVFTTLEILVGAHGAHSY